MKGILLLCKVCRRTEGSVNCCSQQDSLGSGRQRPLDLPRASNVYVCAVMWERVWVEGRKPEGSMRGEKDVLRKRVGESDRTWHADEAVEMELWDRRGQTID